MSSKSIHVPASAEEVTAEWLSVILGYEIDPNSVSITRNAHEGKGFLSNLLRVHCQGLNTTKECKLIVKLLPADPFMREIVVGQSFDKMEIAAYSSILPAAVAQVPELAAYVCPYIFGKFTETVSVSDPSYSSVVVLEDLKPLNYTTLDFGEALTSAHLSDGLDFLARLHFAGALIEDLERKPLSQIYPLLVSDIGTKPELFQIWTKEYYPGVLEMLTNSNMSNEAKAAYVTLSDALNDVVTDIFTPLSNFPSLIHCDLWTNNILYNTDTTKHTKVIDWQVMMYRDATLDLGIFLTASLPIEKLTLKDVELFVHTYYDKFQEFCSSKNKVHLQRRSWEEFYGFFKTYGLAFALVWFILSQTAVVLKNNARLIRTYEYFYEVGVVSFVTNIKKHVKSPKFE